MDEQPITTAVTLSKSTGSKPTTPRGSATTSGGNNNNSSSSGNNPAATNVGAFPRMTTTPTRAKTLSPSPGKRRTTAATALPTSGKVNNGGSPNAASSSAAAARSPRPTPHGYQWEKEKQNLVRLSTEQLMRRALKMHFEILDLRQGAAYLSDQTSVMQDHMTQLELRSISPSEANPSQSPARNNNSNGDLSPKHKRLTAQVAEAVQQLSSLQRAIEGGLGVIGPVSPRRIPMVEPSPEAAAASAAALSEDAPPERKLENSVVLLSQSVHHLLAQAFVLAESVSEAQVATVSSPSRAAEYMALRAAVSAGEKEIEAENSRSSRLQKQLDAMDDTVRSLRAARGDLQDSVQVSFMSLQEEREKLQRDNTDLQIRLRNAELERQRVDAELQRWRDEAQDLQQRVDEMQAANARLESESSMNKFLLDESKRELDTLVQAMSSSDADSAGMAHVLRQQLDAEQAQNAQFREQLESLQSEGPLVTEAALVQQVEMADCESAELEDRLELQHTWLDRLAEMRLRFQRNMMQRQMNELVTRVAQLQAQREEDLDALARRDAEQSAMSEAELARLMKEKEASGGNVKQLQAKLVAAVGSSVLGEREEVRRQSLLMDTQFDLAQTLRDLTFSALRDLDASYATVANQNDRMEVMQTRIDQLEYDKHDTKELRAMLDSAQKAFSSADSEAAKLLQYLGSAREEVARLAEENKRIVDDANSRTAQLEDAALAAQANEQKALDELTASNKRKEELETVVAELEQKLASIIASLEDKLRDAFAEKADLEKRLDEANAQLSERAQTSEATVHKMREDLAAAQQAVLLLAQDGEERSRAILEREAASSTEQASFAEQYCRTLQQRSAKLSDELQQRTSTLSDELQQRSATLSDELQQLRSEHDELQQRNATLSDELQQLRSEHDALQLRNATLSDELRQLRSEHDESRRKSQQQGDHMSALLSSAEKTISDLRAELAQMEKRMQKRDQELQELSSLDGSLAEKQEALTAAERALAELRKEHEALFARTAATEDELRGRIRTLEGDKRTAERKEKEHAEAFALLTIERDKLQQQISDLRNNASHSESDLVKKLSTADTALENEKRRHAETQAHLEQEQKRIADALAALDAERAKVRERDAALDAARADAADERDKLRDQLDELNRQVSQARVGAMQTEGEAQKQVADLNQQLQRLEARLQAQKKDAERREKELLDELAEMQKELSAERQQAASLRNASQATASEAQRTISDLQCQIIDIQTKLDAATAQNESLTKQLQSGDAGAAQLRSELDENKRLLADSTARGEQLAAQLAKITASRDRLKGALKDAVALQDQLSRIAEIQDANQKISFENATLQQQLEELRAAAVDAEKQVMMSKSEFSKLEAAIASSVAAEEQLSRAMAGDAAPTMPSVQSATAQHEAVTRGAKTMSAAAVTVRSLMSNGEITCTSIQGLMKLVDSLSHQLGLPQPMLMAPTPSNTARGVDSVNAVMPPVMGRVRDLIFKANSGSGGSAAAQITPWEKFEVDEIIGRQAVAAEQADDFNDLMEEMVMDVQEKAASEGAKVRRAMDMLEEAQFSMRGRVGSEKLIGALDLLRATPGARRGAALSMLQARARRGGTVILNLNEFDPKYRSIAWLVSTRGALVDHMGDVFRLLFGHPFQLDKTQKSFGTVLGTFLTSIEKMHLGLPPYLLSMETVHVREASDKELSRILINSSMAASHPRAADSPDCSPARMLRDGSGNTATSAAMAHSQYVGQGEAAARDLRVAATELAMAGSPAGSANASAIIKVETQDASIMTDERLSTPPRAPKRVVQSWGSPPPPPAFGVFY